MPRSISNIRPLDHVHRTWASASALLCVTGTCLAPSVYTVVASYCFLMYILFPHVRVHEVGALLLCGFVFGTAGLHVPAVLLFLAAYTSFAILVVVRDLIPAALSGHSPGVDDTADAV